MELEFLKIVGELQTPVLNTIFITFTKLGDLGFVWVLAALLLTANKKTRRYGYILFLTLILNLILGELILKNVFNRERPFEIYPFTLLVEAPITSSFPSGHTSASFAALGFFIFIFKKNIIPVAIISVMIALSRIYLQLHYLSDVIVGAIIGLCVAYLISIIVKKTNYLHL